MFRWKIFKNSLSDEQADYRVTGGILFSELVLTKF